MASDGSLSIADLQLMLKYLKYAAQFPDFPKNFVPPKLTNPSYIPPNKGSQLLIPTYVTLILAVIVVVTRLLVRAFWNGYNVGLDDWTMLGALIATVGISVNHILLVKLGGIGQHIYDLPVGMIARSQQLAFADVQIYIVCAFLTKISICLFIRRLIAGSCPGPTRLTNMLMVFFILISTLAFFLIFFACSPVSAGWNILLRVERPYRCMNFLALLRGLNIVFAVGDWLLLLLPIYVVWKLQLSKRRRIAISFVLGLGGIACIMAIVRMFFLSGVYDTFDPTYNGLLACLWNQLEITLGVITGSLPALSVFLIRFLDYVTGAISSSGSAIVSSLQNFRRGRTTNPWVTEEDKTRGLSVEEKTRGISVDADVRQHTTVDGKRDSYTRVIRVGRDTFSDYASAPSGSFHSRRYTKDEPPSLPPLPYKSSPALAFFDKETVESSEATLTRTQAALHAESETYTEDTDWDLIIQHNLRD